MRELDTHATRALLHAIGPEVMVFIEDDGKGKRSWVLEQPGQEPLVIGHHQYEAHRAVEVYKYKARARKGWL